MLGQLKVAIVADDPISADGARACLETRSELVMVGPGEPGGWRGPAGPDEFVDADALLILVGDLDDEMLSMMERVTRRDLKIVLVARTIHERQLLRAVGYGLVSVIPRQEANFERIAQVLLDTRRGSAAMPGVAVGWLVDHTRLIQRDVLAPLGLTAAGLLPREVDVLRLLAEGLPTNEIAQKLNYSERTIKSIIHAMMTRLGLRNRSHAVAYAMRIGAL